MESSSALARAKKCVKEGADILDIGGQSTRPGAQIISPDLELERVLPVLKLIRKEFPNTLISVDTFYSKVAEKAIEIGVNIINDVSGARQDPDILNVVSNSNILFIINHSRGNSLNMDNFAQYSDVVEEVYNELMQSVEKALASGLSNKQIILDPGIGFAKTDEHNLRLLLNLERFTKTSYPVLVGPSRKRFIGNILGEKDPIKRNFGTNAVICRCVQAKVDIVRVHEILEVNQTIAMANNLWNIN